MANVKSYTVDYDWKAEMKVEIDHDIMTEAELHEINNFWSDAEYRISRSGDVLSAVLKMLARTAMLIALEQNFNTRGVVGEFDTSDGCGQEGWPPMDGSVGIKITYIDISGMLDSDDMSIEAA